MGEATAIDGCSAKVAATASGIAISVDMLNRLVSVQEMVMIRCQTDTVFRNVLICLMCNMCSFVFRLHPQAC